MDRQMKLLLALQQIENVSKLLGDGQFAGFFSSHLVPIKFEIERQICCLTNSQNNLKIEE